MGLRRVFLLLSFFVASVAWTAPRPLTLAEAEQLPRNPVFQFLMRNTPEGGNLVEYYAQKTLGHSPRSKKETEQVIKALSNFKESNLHIDLFERRVRTVAAHIYEHRVKLFGITDSIHARLTAIDKQQIRNLARTHLTSKTKGNELEFFIPEGGPLLGEFRSPGNPNAEKFFQSVQKYTTAQYADKPGLGKEIYNHAIRLMETRGDRFTPDPISRTLQVLPDRKGTLLNQQVADLLEIFGVQKVTYLEPKGTPSEAWATFHSVTGELTLPHQTLLLGRLDSVSIHEVVHSYFRAFKIQRKDSVLHGYLSRPEAKGMQPVFAYSDHVSFEELATHAFEMAFESNELLSSEFLTAKDIKTSLDLLTEKTRTGEGISAYLHEAVSRTLQRFHDPNWVKIELHPYIENKKQIGVLVHLEMKNPNGSIELPYRFQIPLMDPKWQEIIRNKKKFSFRKTPNAEAQKLIVKEVEIKFLKLEEITRELKSDFRSVSQLAEKTELDEATRRKLLSLAMAPSETVARHIPKLSRPCGPASIQQLLLEITR